tara:strand:- start:44 stop:559 length:516 start_codon:yes stop_codon:yes gene_type:complete
MAITIHPNGRIEGINNDNFRQSVPAGTPIQVVSHKPNEGTATNYNSAATNWTATNLTATITPKFSSSNVLIMVNTTWYQNTEDTTGGLTLYRGSTNLTSSTYGIRPFYAFAAAPSGNLDFQHPVNFQFYDTDINTTSATTYTMYYKSDRGSHRLNGIRVGTQMIVLMEIKG